MYFKSKYMKDYIIIIPHKSILEEKKLDHSL